MIAAGRRRLMGGTTRTTPSRINYEDLQRQSQPPNSYHSGKENRCGSTTISEIFAGPIRRSVLAIKPQPAARRNGGIGNPYAAGDFGDAADDYHHRCRRAKTGRTIFTG